MITCYQEPVLVLVIVRLLLLHFSSPLLNWLFQQDLNLRPTSYQLVALPLSYGTINLVRDNGTAPIVSRLSGECFTSKLIDRYCLVPSDGYAPPSLPCQGSVLTSELTGHSYFLFKCLLLVRPLLNPSGIGADAKCNLSVFPSVIKILFW
jgi:hypothetical protein